MNLKKEHTLPWRLSGELGSQDVAAELAKPSCATGVWLGAKYCWFWNDMYQEGLDKFFRASITPHYEIRQGEKTDPGSFVLHAAPADEFREELLLPHWSGQNDPSREEILQIFIEGFLERAADKLSG